MGPDSPTQANLPIQTCFTFWIRPPSWGRNTTNDDDGNDDDTHTHTPSRQRRAREGAQAAAHHAPWERCSRLRAGQSLKGGPLSPDTKKQKKTIVSPFLRYSIFQPATLAPWRSFALYFRLCKKNKNEFRLRVLSRSRLTPHGLRTLPRVAGITPSICKR